MGWGGFAAVWGGYGLGWLRGRLGAAMGWGGFAVVWERLGLLGLPLFRRSGSKSF